MKNSVKHFFILLSHTRDKDIHAKLEKFSVNVLRRVFSFSFSDRLKSQKLCNFIYIRKSRAITKRIN